MNKIVLFILIFIVSSSLYAEKKITLQLSWLHQFQFAGYYMAKEMGYYADAGLDVSIQEFKYGSDITSMVDNGEVDFAVGRASLLVDKFQGSDVVAIAAIFQESPLMLLVTKKSGINNIEDFKNKKVMITSDAKSSASIIAMLESRGISLDDITIQEHTFNVEDLINGTTDAMASYISNEPIILEERNIDYKIFYPQDYGFQFYDDILFTSSKFIKENPETSKDFYEASLKGWEYAFKNIAKTAEVIHSKYNSQNKSIIQLVKEGEILQRLVYNETFGEIGCIDTDVLEKIASVYKILGLITSDVDLDEFIYEEHKHSMFKVELTDVDMFYLTLFGGLLVFGIVIAIIYLFIQKKWLVSYKHLENEISEAKREFQHQKQTLEDQYKKLHLIINNSNKIIVLKDENLNYVECNNYFAKLVGKEVEEIIGKNDFYLFDEPLAQQIREIDTEVLQGAQEQTRIDTLRFPTSSVEQVFKSYFQPFEYDEGKIGLIVFSTIQTE